MLIRALRFSVRRRHHQMAKLGVERIDVLL